MWGCEAVAVRHDGRANPNQLMMTPETQGSIAAFERRSSPLTANGSARLRTPTFSSGCS